MTRAVLDSGVLVSAFLTSEGVSAKLLHLASKDFFHIYICDEIFKEIKHVLLEYPHIRKRYYYSNRQVEMFCQGLREVTHLVSKLPTIKVVISDKNDDMVVACAVKAKANYIVTRDEDMLSLSKYRGTKIITPEEFIDIIRKMVLSSDSG